MTQYTWDPTTNNVVLFFVLDFKIVYNNNDYSSITIPWAREENICVTTYLEINIIQNIISIGIINIVIWSKCL